MNRLLNGFNYFWDKKPSNFTDKDVLFLHQWMKLLKESINKASEPMDEVNMVEIARKIFDN